VLEELVVEDLSIAQIAARVDRSASTVRHWLRYHGLETTAAARRRQNAGVDDEGDVSNRSCAHHGGVCAACGYERCIAALQFHHLDPATKRFNLSLKGLARSYAEARAEAQKCVLLCANCHAEVEAGVLQLPR
jgi:transposase